MKVRCECGREFEVPDGTEVAKCRACGRAVRPAESRDWLKAVDVDALSLETETPQAEAPSEKPVPKAPPVAEQQPRAEAPSAAGAPVSRTGRAREGAAAPPKAPEPPAGIIELIRVLQAEPKDVAVQLRAGSAAPRFMAELGGALAGLGLFSVALLTWLAAPKGFAVGWMFTMWLGLLVEAGASAIMLALLSVLLKREAKPLGAAEGVVFARVMALAILVPLGIFLGVIVLATIGREQGPPSALIRFNRMLPKVYLGAVTLAQTFLTVGLFRLGCGGSLLASAVAVFAAATLAERVIGMF